MKIKKYLMVVLIGFAFMLSSCSRRNESVVSNTCTDYNYFLEVASKDFLNQLVKSQILINQDNYNDTILNTKKLDITVDQDYYELDLTGIQCFSYVTHLKLTGASIRDLSPLNGLNKLEVLDLESTNVSNLYPLKNLGKLRSLTIHNTMTLTNLNGLEQLTTLKTLDLANNKITSIHTIQTLPVLETLNVENNELNFDHSPYFTGFKSLKNLNLKDNHICKTELLGDLVNLTSLNLSDNNLMNKESLESCQNQTFDSSFINHLIALEILKLNNNDLKQVDWIKTIPNQKLKQLELMGNELDSISSITGNPLLKKSITHINLNQNQLNSLNTIDQFTQLEILKISSNQISDLSPIYTLTGLTEFDGSSNLIEDIPKMDGKFPKMESLNLANNLIKQIDSMENLNSLKVIDLSNNQISEIHHSFNQMDQLITVRLDEQNVIHTIDDSFNHVPRLVFGDSDLFYFSFLTDHLSISHSFNQLSVPTEVVLTDKDIVSISDDSFLLPNATDMNLDVNQLTNLKFVKNCSNLINLSAKNNKIQDISGLNTLSQLTSLNLSNNEITSIYSIKSLTLLIKLDLSNNQIDEFNAISNMKELEELNFSNNRIQDVSPLQEFPKLSQVNLENNLIKQLNGINQIPLLEYLSLKGNPIETINGLNEIMCKNLDLSNMNLSSISKDSFNQSSFSTLNLSHNQLTDISFLLNIQTVNQLDLSYNQLTTVDNLQDRKDINELYLNDNPITILSGLNSLSALYTLTLPTSITEIKNALNLTDYLKAINESKPSEIFNLLTISHIENSFNSYPFNTIEFPEGFGQDVTISQSFNYLRTLDLNKTTFTSIDFIKDMRELTVLRLSGNRSIKELTNLSCDELIYLEEVDLTNSSVETIDSSFNHCTNLSRVKIDTTSPTLNIKDSFNLVNINEVTINEEHTVVTIENSFDLTPALSNQMILPSRLKLKEGFI